MVAVLESSRQSDGVAEVGPIHARATAVADAMSGGHEVPLVRDAARGDAGPKAGGALGAGGCLEDMDSALVRRPRAVITIDALLRAYNCPRKVACRNGRTKPRTHRGLAVGRVRVEAKKDAICRDVDANARESGGLGEAVLDSGDVLSNRL